jgi:hypothetical protein
MRPWKLQINIIEISKMLTRILIKLFCVYDYNYQEGLRDGFWLGMLLGGAVNVIRRDIFQVFFKVITK